MTSNQKNKAILKERIRVSNANQAIGLAPDSWVVEFRKKNNEIKAKWKARQPKKKSTKRVSNSGSFIKGQIPHNKKSEEHKAASLIKWRQNTREWHRHNKERINEQRRFKRQTDIHFRIACNLRKRLSFLVRQSSAKKTSQTLKLLDCDMTFFLQHLESLFEKGMSFSNYGKWHIDHIIPCDSFNLTKPEDQAKCFHYTNLQPLWAEENRTKSNKIAA